MYTRDEPTYFILNADKAESGYGKGPRIQPCAFWNEFIPLITPGTSSCKLNEYVSLVLSFYTHIIDNVMSDISVPSRCGRERWDMNQISSHQPSWRTAAATNSNIFFILVTALITQLCYSHLFLFKTSIFTSSIISSSIESARSHFKHSMLISNTSSVKINSRDILSRSSSKV